MFRRIYDKRAGWGGAALQNTQDSGLKWTGTSVQNTGWHKRQSDPQTISITEYLQSVLARKNKRRPRGSHTVTALRVLLKTNSWSATRCKTAATQPGDWKKLARNVTDSCTHSSFIAMSTVLWLTDLDPAAKITSFPIENKTPLFLKGW